MGNLPVSPNNELYRMYKETIQGMLPSERILQGRERTVTEKRFLSVEQACIITEVYKEHQNAPTILKRAYALKRSLEALRIRIDPEELIVGNRSYGIRSGIVSPEAGIEWIHQELDTFHSRPQDRFEVQEADKRIFREHIYPFWKGKGLRDEIERAGGAEISFLEKVVKINQKDHAQGHICPDVKKWLTVGPLGLIEEAREKLDGTADEQKKHFYKALIIVLEGVIAFFQRYRLYAEQLAQSEKGIPYSKDLLQIAKICEELQRKPPTSFHAALQSVWFLFVVLHMESNANSFSPGRLDQVLYPYFDHDITHNIISLEKALELIDALYIKLNHIVYMRNSLSAKYFAGFTTGFNIALGGILPGGKDATNLLSFLFLKAQDHIRLPQPNLSVRLHEKTPQDFLMESSRVISLGTGMPQVFNDESIIPTLKRQGISADDAEDYAIVGCVELTTPGNNLGWSDAAMFNLLKVLELTLNNGRCLLTHEKIGLETGYLYEYSTFEELEAAFTQQLDSFIEKMHHCCSLVDAMHAKILPSPFLSSVISDCIQQGVDVTAGGAHYNFSGVQVIQVANIADSMEALKFGVFEQKLIDKKTLLKELQNNFEGSEHIRQALIQKIPKFGNDNPEVDTLANKWIEYLEGKIGSLKNVRGGKYQIGLYTVSAHVPMGLNVGATPDGRKAKEPLADGGMSPVYGRDKLGPSAVLQSVSRIKSYLGSNGTLLNMKFSPDMFETQTDLEKFSSFLKAFIRLRINHVQFNVISKDELLKAQQYPQRYQNLLIRVAGYTAYFTELAKELQDEIIQRTTYGEL